MYLAPATSRYLKQRGDGHWQLFDLSKDPGETTDLADREPARLTALTAGWNRYALAKGVVSPAAPVVQKSSVP